MHATLVIHAAKLVLDIDLVKLQGFSAGYAAGAKSLAAYVKPAYVQSALAIYFLNLPVLKSNLFKLVMKMQIGSVDVAFVAVIPALIWPEGLGGEGLGFALTVLVCFLWTRFASVDATLRGRVVFHM